MTAKAGDLEQFRLPTLGLRRSSGGAWCTDYDVLDGEEVVGRIYRVTDHPASPWVWAIPARLAGRKAYRCVGPPMGRRARGDGVTPTKSWIP